MNIFSFRWLRCAPLLTLPVWLGCEVGNTVTRPTCVDLAQGIGGMAGNDPAPGAGSGGTVYGVTAGTAGMGGFIPTPYVAPPLVQEDMPEDPGPKCLDCTQGRDIEHVVVIDFEDGYAPAWFSFDEQQYPIAPLQTPDGEPNEPPYWGLHVADLATTPARQRCGSSYALRLQGGPYTQWGGGAGTSYFRLKGAQIDRYCPARIREILPMPGLPTDECGFSIAPAYEMPTTGDLSQRLLVASAWGKSVAGFDASQFDGVAFWARRAPGGSTGLQISLEDFNTSDAAAKTAQIEAQTSKFVPNLTLLNGRQPACTRALECCGRTSVETGSRPSCNLVNVPYGAGVTPYGFADTTGNPEYAQERLVPEYRCYVEDIDSNGEPIPTRVATPAGGQNSDAYDVWNTWHSKHKLCCPTDFDDPQFGKSPVPESAPPRERQKECVAYVVEGNFENAGTQYCWDPGDPAIPPADENRCGDGFRAFVNLSTEWKLFRVPWSELRRSTIGKGPIDTTSIWSLNFYWRQGMLDTYIDDIGFYKKKQ
jgi:hypothetical protein